jgi:predicted double-glycine peptidase
LKAPARALFFAAALALGAGVAAEERTPVRSLLEIRQQNVIVQRWDASCGAAALATVLTYHLGQRVSEKALAEAMLGRTDPLRVKVRGGFSLLDLKRYAESAGFVADGYAKVPLAELDDLRPAIVPVVFFGFPHFVVYRGRIGQQVLLADPAFGNRLLEVEKFEQAWQNIAFVVTRPKDSAAQEHPRIELQDYIRASPEAIRSAVSR